MKVAQVNWLTCFAVCWLLGPLGIRPSDAAGQEDGQSSEQSRKAGLVAPLSGFSDEGVFFLFKNETRLATMSFQWKDDGSFKGESTLSMAGQSIRSSLSIEVGKDGRWERMSMETPAGPVEVTRDGAKASITHRGKTVTTELRANTMLFENFTPALMSQAIRAYDQKKGGKQEFPIFFVPQIVMDGSLTRNDTVERAIGGRDLEFIRYTLGIPGLDVIVWADLHGKLYLADIPAQHSTYVREGFEALRVEEEADPLISVAKYETKEKRDVRIPMRDGVDLSTDIYLPKTQGPFPVILVRTPYKKEMAEQQAHFYTRRGYAVAVQDCRGRFASAGKWEPFIHEPEDGYDTIEWLAAQPWSSGKVGMIGASYLGWVQWWAAGQRPPHLVTIIPNVSPPDPFYNIPYEYGVFFLFGSIWWADILETEATADLSGQAMGKIGDKKYHKLLRSLPVIDLDLAVLGKKNPYWRKWIDHPTNDEYWEQANFLDRLKECAIPVFHQSGWFDGDGIGTKLNYGRMVSHGHPNQKLVIGPWGHTSEAQRRVGDRDFGPEAIIDLQRAYLRWFDYWLKGVPNGITNEPLVSVFVMGSNKWLRGNTYPLPETRFQKWYLESDGGANTSGGDGRLAPSRPPKDSSPDVYTYDPGDPTPSPQFYEEPEDTPDGGGLLSVEQKKEDRVAYHERVVGARKDILVYVTEPFDEPLTFVGPITAVLYASSSARDTDWFVRLMEVESGGKIFFLAEGKIRARYRESSRHPELLEPDRVYKYEIDLWHTGITVPKGRRLRVEVASASFPLFSRNLNTGGHNEKETKHVPAKQTIYHDSKRPSHILLPVIQSSD